MKQSVSVALMAALVALSCKDSTSPKAGPAANIAASWVIADIAVAGEETPTRPSVRVTDAANRPVPGVTVTFVVASGGGTIEGGTQVTNEFGVATVSRWILGRNFGINQIVASAPNLPLVEFKVRGIAPDGGVLAFDVADPAGDTAARPVGGHPAVDILRVRGDFKRDSLILTFTFGSPVTFGTADAANSIGGSIELDMDDNAETGYKPPDANFFGGTAEIGVDYVYDLFNSTPTRLLLFSRLGMTRPLISYPGTRSSSGPRLVCLGTTTEIFPSRSTWGRTSGRAISSRTLVSSSFAEMAAVQRSSPHAGNSRLAFRMRLVLRLLTGEKSESPNRWNHRRRRPRSSRLDHRRPAANERSFGEIRT